MNGLTRKFRVAAGVWLVSCTLAAAAIFAPVMDAALFPVVRIVRADAVRQAGDNGAIVVTGEIDKLRGGCRITELYAMGGTPARMLSMARGDSGGAPEGILYSRPAGRSAIGPWVIHPAPAAGEPLTLHVWHDCGMPWQVYTLLMHMDKV